jgi:hypothetical protein
MNTSCWHCPYGFLPGEKCLNDPEDFGHAMTCRFGFDNACESLIIGNNVFQNNKSEYLGRVIYLLC